MRQISRQRCVRRKGDFLAPHKRDISGCGAGHLRSRIHVRREALAPCLFFDVAAGASRIDPDDVREETSVEQRGLHAKAAGPKAQAFVASSPKSYVATKDGSAIAGDF